MQPDTSEVEAINVMEFADNAGQEVEASFWNVTKRYVRLHRIKEKKKCPNSCDMWKTTLMKEPVEDLPPTQKYVQKCNLIWEYYLNAPTK